MIINKIIPQHLELQLSIPPSIKPHLQKILDRVRETIRIKHYSYRTEESYVFWIRRYILFHDQQHPKDMNSAEIEAFLSYLAIKENVAASTQNQALSALLFLYREVLKIELNTPVDAIRAKCPRYLLTVLTQEEALEVIRHIHGTYQLIVQLLLGYKDVKTTMIYTHVVHHGGKGVISPLDP